MREAPSRGFTLETFRIKLLTILEKSVRREREREGRRKRKAYRKVVSDMVGITGFIAGACIFLPTRLSNSISKVSSQLCPGRKLEKS